MLNGSTYEFRSKAAIKQFPKMNALRSTLLQHQAHSMETVNAVQIFHIKRNHWIVASTKPKGKLVRMYDSVFSSVDQETARIIQTNFRCAMHSIRSKWVLKTAACLQSPTSIANGEDPSMREYYQGMMRMYLSKCFLNKHLECFPNAYGHLLFISI